MRLVILLLLLPLTAIRAQDYNVAFIPDSLLNHANAVKRFEELKVTIMSPSKAIARHKWAITILNEAGERFATYGNYYNKFRSLSDISGHLYDLHGRELKSVKKKDITDVAVNDGMSLIQDDRMKEHNFYYKQYPYTVEYEDEVDYNGIFFLPEWEPVENTNFSVQASTYIVEFPLDYKIRYKQFNYPSRPDSVVAKTNTFSWKVNNIKPLRKERFEPSFTELTTCVFIAPTDFEFGGYTGNMKTWKDLGDFMLKLNAGLDELPANIKQDIHRLADAVPDKAEKIRVLYEYMQKNTHYIGIQMGIGGYQPFPAKYVAANGYGDCKALSNYMVSILREAGLNANYVLINANTYGRGLWEDFPSPHFNHAIMCVPDGKDTTWLECTSQTESAGFMGSETCNKKVLMITKDGGVVVNTPRYKPSDNLQHRSVNATIDESGNMTAEVNTRFTGLQQEYQHFLIYDNNKEEREKRLNKMLALPTYVVEKSDYKETKGKIPMIDEYLKLTAPDFATVTGKRLFIRPNVFNEGDDKLDTDKPRVFPIQFTQSFKDIDSVSLTLPADYQPESVPANVNIHNKFGNYSISFKVEGNKVIMYRTNEWQANTFPASDYPELVKFYEAMYKADRSRIVLVKKES